MICPVTDRECRTNGCGEKCYKRDSLGYTTKHHIDESIDKKFEKELQMNSTNDQIKHSTATDGKPHVMCCFNCIFLGIKPKSGKHWCVNDKSYLSGYITHPHWNKCSLHVLEK